MLLFVLNFNVKSQNDSHSLIGIGKSIALNEVLKVITQDEYYNDYPFGGKR